MSSTLLDPVASDSEPELSTPETGQTDTPHYPKPISASGGRVRWDYMIVFALVHLAAMLIFVPYFFSWTGVAVFAISVFVFGVLGVNIGLHRLLSHRSFRTPKWFERTLATLAMCSAQETPAHWVAWHRKHHVHSDKPDDPHTPRVGIFWSHMDWLLHDHQNTMSLFSLYDKYARDIISDPYYRWIERLPISAGFFYVMHSFVYVLLAGGLGWWMYGWNAEGFQLAASVFVWGVPARTVYVWHITWSVNSLTHLIGYRTYQTTDDSRNSWFVALITLGEGWHNNHHSDPSSASVQHKWWEVDPIYHIIRFWSVIGLASHVIPARPTRLANRTATQSGR
jgi:fatty-acid desaturase